MLAKDYGLNLMADIAQCSPKWIIGCWALAYFIFYDTENIIKVLFLADGSDIFFIFLYYT